ncbi:MAG: GTPase HflX, partial [Rhodospirillales bacterium]|nr:GTPase HflX [Rhodospirillales bacterium]
MVHPRGKAEGSAARDAQSRLAEAVGLAQAIALSVVAAESVPLIKPKPATLFGSGTVERLGEIVKERAVDLAVIDARLSPVQQRNLEKAWGCKVIDRTGLILEIFGARARTREGRLQVELAALTYQKSRLVRSWTHLERQRGGFGFLGGPGETQIETDRRLIGERIAKLGRELDEVRRTRDLHRRARRRVPYPIVALVGYTNAGKSTLFNALTRATVYVQDQLFATLDPTMRGLDLPSGRTVILSDTVGFVSDLPHELVAAFRATLEEVLEADLILHVRDIAHPDSESQKTDVETVLRELGLETAVEQGLLEVWNKIDLLAEGDRDRLLESLPRQSGGVAVSALAGTGLDDLKRRIDAVLAASRHQASLDVPIGDGAALAWLYAHGEVLDRCDDD